MKKNKLNKRYLSLALTLSVAAGMAGSAMAATYTDAQGNWAQADINSVVDMNVMTGFNDGMFHPDAWLTRSEFSAMSAKAVGLTPSQADKIPALKKVSSNAWSFGPVDDAELLSSYPAGVYRPESPLRRVEMLVGLAGTLNAPLVSDADAQQILARYSDADQVPASVRREVATALQNNLFAIDPKVSGNMIAPLRPAQRAEVATVLNNLAQHRDLTIVRNGQIVATANSGSQLAAVDSAQAGANSTAAVAGQQQAGVEEGTAAADASAPAASNTTGASAMQATQSQQSAEAPGVVNNNKLPIKAPYRNSADTITESRLVNQTSTPSGLDPSALSSLAPDTVLSTTVAKALYSEFNKPGDPVLLIVNHAVMDSAGKIVIPAGSKLVGSLNKVVSRNESGDDARLGIQLSEIIVPSGQRMPINGSVANADGILSAKDLQSVLTQKPDHSTAALKREIGTAQGSLYGTKVGKSEVLEEPYSAQLSAKPVDPMDKRDNNIVIGVGDQLQVRLGAAAANSASSQNSAN